MYVYAPRAIPKLLIEDYAMSRIRLFDTPPTPYTERPMPLDESLQWVSSNQDKVKPHVGIFFVQSAYKKCLEHTLSDVAREVGGALIGEVRYDSLRSQTYIVIQDIIPASFTNSGETHLTFTQDTLLHFNEQMETLFPGKRMIGWYHTHPRLGVFMSGHDTFLHRHFFPDPIQVALVVDPVSKLAGFFCWQNGQTLDPKNYIGFYELSDVDDHSIVEWENLAPVIPGNDKEEREV
jgi:proteasome lid subunit RPN8/RPN11